MLLLKRRMQMHRMRWVGGGVGWVGGGMRSGGICPMHPSNQFRSLSSAQVRFDPSASASARAPAHKRSDRERCSPLLQSKFICTRTDTNKTPTKLVPIRDEAAD